MLGWLARLCLLLVVLGVVVVEGVAVLAADVAAGNDAGLAARTASATLADTGDTGRAYAAAAEALATTGAGSALVPERFAVGPDGTVSVQVQRTATTLLLHRSERTAGYGTVTGEASSGFRG